MLEVFSFVGCVADVTCRVEVDLFRFSRAAALIAARLARFAAATAVLMALSVEEACSARLGRFRARSASLARRD